MEPWAVPPPPYHIMTLARHLTLASVCPLGQRDGNTLPGDRQAHGEVATRCRWTWKAALIVTCCPNTSSLLHAGNSLKDETWITSCCWQWAQSTVLGCCIMAWHLEVLTGDLPETVKGQQIGWQPADSWPAANSGSLKSILSSQVTPSSPFAI